MSAHRRGQLVEFADRLGATEFMVYQAALAVLLHHLGGGTDIVIGSPVAARVDVDSVNRVGPVANVVVLRTRLTGDPTLRTVVERSRATVLDALAHQELPIERLVEAINPPRSPSRNHPLFQNSIHFRGDDWSLVTRRLTEDGDTTVAALPVDFDASLLDLNVAVDVTADGGLQVRVVGNADLYEPKTVRHLTDALDATLAAFVATPGAPLSALRVLPADVMERLLAPPAAAAPATTAPAAQPPAGGTPATEQALIDLLSELLDIDDVEREDNFFALGGDSIVSVQMSARATAQGLALTPAMVFEHMTIAELAAAVDVATAARAQTGSDGTDGEGATDEIDEALVAQRVDASGLDADALAALTASWNEHS
jgi:mycobactin peptide synthetase MbtE